MTKDISQLALEKIQHDHITPKSRAEFVLKNFSVWSVVLLTIVLGSLIWAVLGYLAVDDLPSYGHMGPMLILRSLPYFWFIMLAIFIIATVFAYRQTVLGYRQSSRNIILFCLAAVIAIGALAYSTGFGGFTEQTVANNLPYYNKLYNRQLIWSQPQSGLIAGRITSIKTGELSLIDLQGNVWSVDTSSAVKRPRADISVGAEIKIIGKMISGHQFTAEEIRPWQGMGMMGGGMMR